ncbi:hypothetical protein BC833DRAFT_648417 [Globomyces pollinis-pini]|nr:hypothetical protein BC833DRAFT_648417 [Globomyces pollinis-pini]
MSLLDKFLSFTGKDKVRSHQVIIAVLPVFFYTSYALYNRVILGNEPDLSKLEPKIMPSKSDN